MCPQSVKSMKNVDRTRKQNFGTYIFLLYKVWYIKSAKSEMVVNVVDVTSKLLVFSYVLLLGILQGAQGLKNKLICGLSQLR